MPLTVAVTGQILLHGPLDHAMPEARMVRSMLSADFAFANLEATVESAGAWPTKTKTLHLATIDALPSLKALGFDAVTHANNHAFDLGPPGIKATRKAAVDAGLAFTGSGSTIAEARAPAILNSPNGSLAVFAVDLGPQPEIVYASIERAGIAPLRMKRTVIVPSEEYGTLQNLVRTLRDDQRETARSAAGYRAGAESSLELLGTAISMGDQIEARWSTIGSDLEELMAAMAAAKSQGHVVALSLHSHHWDPEWRNTPAWLIELSRQLIDAGADMVAVTGAPVLQGLTFHRGRPIFGGLGNFVFHTRRSSTYEQNGTDVWRSVIAKLSLAADGACSSIEILPISVGRPAEQENIARPPAPLSGEDAAAIFDRVVRDLSPAERDLVKRIS